MALKVKNDRLSCEKSFDDIKVGTVFTGLIGTIRGTFLKSFGSIVHLENPVNDWGPENAPIVKDYLAVDADLILHPLKKEAKP